MSLTHLESYVLLKEHKLKMVEEFCAQYAASHPGNDVLLAELKKRWVARLVAKEVAGRVSPPKTEQPTVSRPPSSEFVQGNTVKAKILSVSDMEAVALEKSMEKYKGMKQPEKKKESKQTARPPVSPSGSEFDPEDIDDPSKLFSSKNCLRGHYESESHKRGINLKLKSVVLNIGNEELGFSDVDLSAPF